MVTNVVFGSGRYFLVERKLLGHFFPSCASNSRTVMESVFL